MYSSDIQSPCAVRMKLKYENEDLSFPTKTLAKVLENTGYHFIFRNVALTNFSTPWETDRKSKGLALKRN